MHLKQKCESHQDEETKEGFFFLELVEKLFKR